MIGPKHLGKASCPSPAKVRYGSRSDAERAMPGVWQVLRGGPELRPYECQCGSWHLTSRPQRAVS